MDSNKDFVALVGRVLLAVMFVWAGFGKITGYAGTAGFMASAGMPHGGPAASGDNCGGTGRRHCAHRRLEGALRRAGAGRVHAGRYAGFPPFLEHAA